MLRTGDQARFDRDPHVGGENPKLVLGPVGIVGALQCQDRRLNGGEEAGDVEGAEPRVQPGVVPSPERDFDIAVVAGEALAQVAGLVRGRDLADAGDVEVFDEEVGGDGDEAEERDPVMTGGA